jgi:hypothetical protein
MIDPVCGDGQGADHRRPDARNATLVAIGP